jgi:transcriptional regulator GlxA family with amidase domain
VLRNVAVALTEPTPAFEVGVVCEVFGQDRSAAGLPNYDFALCSADGGPVRTTSGFVLVPHAGYDRLRTADLVVVLAGPPTPSMASPALIVELLAAVDRGARVMSVCSGAFVLAEAGLLEGRRATTHWLYAPLLTARHPTVRVDADALYVEDGPVLTSAGSASAIDLCLHVVRLEHGAEIANRVARRMVVPPHRDGGQAQYVETPVPDPRAAGELEQLLGWMLGHLDEPLTVESLAARAVMSPRTFARRFRALTGTTPHHWLISQRLLLAQRMLESTDEGVEHIAARCGFGSADVLRHHFGRLRGTSPQAYRRTFRSIAA